MWEPRGDAADILLLLLLLLLLDDRAYEVEQQHTDDDDADDAQRLLVLQRDTQQEAGKAQFFRMFAEEVDLPAAAADYEKDLCGSWWIQ